MSKQKRAFIWAAAVGIFFVVPIGYRAWLEFGSVSSLANYNLGEVVPFVYRDRQNDPVTMDHVERAVTIVIHVPDQLDPKGSNIVDGNVSLIVDWVKKNLTVRYSEEKNPLNLFKTGPGKHLDHVLSEWRFIDETILDQTLIPSGYDLSKPWLVVIDGNRLFTGAWSLESPINVRLVQSALSRTTFEQYLGNYLARRTFMGPRREAK
ncbi:MAG: hypothetical protein NT027_11065 [Proteobacteria bacterium]|nr:hypothetical protein [Pseudomonadota bacterium]